MKTIVVLPTYNEADNLSLMIERLRGLALPDLCVLVVDDNSPDGTGQVADALRAAQPEFLVEVMHRPGKLGLGTAYIQGFRRALELGADYVIQMDTDFSHPVEAIPRLLEAAGGADVVVGSRYAPGGQLDATWGWQRRLFSWGANSIIRWRTGLALRDTTGGFRCYRRKVLETLDFGKVRSDGFAFQFETAYAIHRLGFRFAEVPILFRDRARGQSKMSSRIILEALWRAWEMKGRY